MARPILFAFTCLFFWVGAPPESAIFRPANVACCPPETTFTWQIPAASGKPRVAPRPFRVRLREVLVSENGRYRAGNYTILGEEAGSVMLLCDGNRVLGWQPYALALVWEPGGNRLLCTESAADNDLRHFVLDVGRGEYRKNPARRQGWVLGERSDQFRAWRGDTLFFESYLSPGKLRPVRIPPLR